LMPHRPEARRNRNAEMRRKQRGAQRNPKGRDQPPSRLLSVLLRDLCVSAFRSSPVPPVPARECWCGCPPTRGFRVINPFFPRLRSGHRLFQRPSSQKQFLSSRR
jgi:hypothetical protein